MNEKERFRIEHEVIRELYGDANERGKWIHELAEMCAKRLTAEDIIPFPLFHGTSDYALSLSNAERDKLLNDCNCVIDYYNKTVVEHEHAMLAKAGRISKGFYANEVRGVLNQFHQIMKDRANGLGNKHVFLTSGYEKAIRYAEIGGVCGRLFYVANGLDNIITRLGIECSEPTKGQSKAIARIREVSSIRSKPVVMCFDNMFISDIDSMASGSEDINGVLETAIRNACIDLNMNGSLGFCMPDDFPISSGFQVNESGKMEIGKDTKQKIYKKFIQIMVEVEAEQLPELVRNRLEKDYASLINDLSDDDRDKLICDIAFHGMSIKQNQRNTMFI